MQLEEGNRRSSRAKSRTRYPRSAFGLMLLTSMQCVVDLENLTHTQPEIGWYKVVEAVLFEKVATTT